MMFRVPITLDFSEGQKMEFSITTDAGSKEAANDQVQVLLESSEHVWIWEDGTEEVKS